MTASREMKAGRVAEHFASHQRVVERSVEQLAGPAEEVARALIRALDGELANVRGSRPENLQYAGAAESLQQVWIALRASERQILEGVTLAHVARHELPELVVGLVANPAAWS